MRTPSCLALGPVCGLYYFRGRKRDFSRSIVTKLTDNLPRTPRLHGCLQASSAGDPSQSLPASFHPSPKGASNLQFQYSVILIFHSSANVALRTKFRSPVAFTPRRLCSASSEFPSAVSAFAPAARFGPVSASRSASAAALSLSIHPERVRQSSC